MLPDQYLNSQLGAYARPLPEHLGRNGTKVALTYAGQYNQYESDP